MQPLPWTADLTFYCPWARRHVTVRCLTYDGRTPIGILSCSAFEDGEPSSCGTGCVERAAGGVAAAAGGDRAVGV